MFLSFTKIKLFQFVFKINHPLDEEKFLRVALWKS